MALDAAETAENGWSESYTANAVLKSTAKAGMFEASGSMTMNDNGESQTINYSAKAQMVDVPAVQLPEAVKNYQKTFENYLAKRAEIESKIQALNADTALSNYINANMGDNPYRYSAYLYLSQYDITVSVYSEYKGQDGNRGWEASDSYGRLGQYEPSGTDYMIITMDAAGAFTHKLVTDPNW